MRIASSRQVLREADASNMCTYVICRSTQSMVRYSSLPYAGIEAFVPSDSRY